MPKKGRITMIPNKKNDLITVKWVTSWRVCMVYQKLNGWAEKDHFLMYFMYQILDNLVVEIIF